MFMWTGNRKEGRVTSISDDPTTWTCRHCGHVGVRIEWRLEARPLGTFSLAGVQTKVSVREHPYAVCEGCGHESRGEQ